MSFSSREESRRRPSTISRTSSTSTFDAPDHELTDPDLVPLRPIPHHTSSSRSATQPHAPARSSEPRLDQRIDYDVSNTTTFEANQSTIHNRRARLRSDEQAFKDKPVGHSLLHGIGLKPFTVKSRYTSGIGGEIPKPVVVKSKRLAIASLVTHLLPSCITIFLITWNAIVFVNGPPISTIAEYCLQGAAKLHELTIVGSLGKITFDLLRNNLVQEGVGFGMLSSPFSFPGLNYLWSQEFFSAVQDACRLRMKRHIFFLLVLIIFCLLSAAVGPASAVLCLPSPAWLSAGSTSTYIIGSQEQVWPLRLTKEHTSPRTCRDDNINEFYCLQGSWETIKSLVISDGIHGKSSNVADMGIPRTIWSWRPPPNEPHGTDTWATTPHGATAYVAFGVNSDHDRAWNFAKGRPRRLRDGAPSGTYAQILAPLPVVRVLCAPVRPVSQVSPELLFPVLSPDREWRSNDNAGPTKELSVNGSFSRVVQATWTALPADFGTSTVGIAIVTSNGSGSSSASTGCGCSFDARWAEGYTALNGGNRFFEPYIGDPALPEGLKYASPQKLAFFHEKIKPFLGQPITADDDWIKDLAIGFGKQNATPDSSSSLEDILIGTRVFDTKDTLKDNPDTIRAIEAALSAYFVNALTKVGWAPAQLNSSLNGINPNLRQGNRDTDTLLYDNSELWRKPVGVPFQSVKQQWFVYATAWQLNDPALYISVVILCAHLLVVLIDCAVTLRSRESSEAWNSVSELLALAYLSVPDRETLKNCGAGIMLQKTLGQRVKVVVVDDDEDSTPRVQLVPCSTVPNYAVAATPGSEAVRSDETYR